METAAFGGLVPPFPKKIQNYAQNDATSILRRPSAFVNNVDPSVYGYAIIQRPYLVPISSTSVYMSCYTTINNNEAHYYVNGDFLAEKLKYEEDEEEVF